MGSYMHGLKLFQLSYLTLGEAREPYLEILVPYAFGLQALLGACYAESSMEL